MLLPKRIIWKLSLSLTNIVSVNVVSLEISECSIIKNRDDVPVVGMFSAARFLR